MNSRTVLFLASAIAIGATAAPAAAAPCQSLAALALPRTTITAREVAAGAFKPEDSLPQTLPPNPPYANLPAFCRVTAILKPTSDSDIHVEVWLPMAGWNRKLQSVGNGGWAGVIAWPALGAALAQGYAAAATDTGHVANNARFAPGHPEKLVDYGYRAVHEMTVTAKAVVAAYYESGAALAYWNGCSTGGRQGLMEALRYPADYDGIIAGAPVNYRTHQLIGELWIAKAVHRDTAHYIPPEKYAAIHQAALAACDARDGLKDGLIDNPTTCRFDPKVIECKSGDSPSCLTPPQVEAARQIYSPSANPRTKAEIFPALQPGSELSWGGLAGPQPVFEAVDFFQYVVKNDPAWDFHTLNFDGDVALADRAAADLFNVIDPDLKPFFDRGGKLLLYHGWSDQLVAPLNSINYYQSVIRTLGTGQGDASPIRLFMMPGMTHCQGGEGPNTFDRMSVIEQWVEHKQPPARIVASHATNGTVDRTRPLCPYPQVARYTGTGSIDDAANFVCKAESR